MIELEEIHIPDRYHVTGLGDLAGRICRRNPRYEPLRMYLDGDMVIVEAPSVKVLIHASRVGPMVEARPAPVGPQNNPRAGIFAEPKNDAKAKRLAGLEKARKVSAANRRAKKKKSTSD